MKKHCFSTFLCLFLPVLLISQPTRHALIIAVGNYPTDSGWSNLASGRDAALLQGVLLKQGFSENNIHILRDSEATHSGINDALQTLVSAVQPDDVVLIHFSGHGQQITDDNRDEADGYDEALVPYDSPMRYRAGKYEGERLFRDDMLGHHISLLRNRLGPNGTILVMLDACHSGTGLRGSMNVGVRGTDQPMASQAYQHKINSLPMDQNQFLEEFEPGETSIGAPVIAFFAASAHEANLESRDEQGQRIGSLTHAFCKAFAQIQPFTTYRVLFEQIKMEMYSQATTQNPQAEGALDRRVLNGQIIVQPTHFEVKTIADKKTLIISAGQLKGVSESSELVFFPAGTYDTAQAQPLSIGVVESADLLESIVVLEKPVEPRDMIGALAYLRSQSWHADILRVKVALPDGHRKDSILAALIKWPRVQLEGTDFDYLISNCTNKNNTICVQARGQSLDYVLSVEESRPNKAGLAVTEALSNLAIANFLRGLTINDEALQVKLDIIPFRKSLDSTLPTMKYHVYEDTVALRVTNTGLTACYYTVLDIQPDGQVNVILPQPGRTAADYFLQPGATSMVGVSWFTPPTGVEVFKIIASREPIDLRAVVKTRGMSVRGKAHPNMVETLLAFRYDNSNMEQTRAVKQLAPGNISVTTLAVRIE
jgi:hypothetical protein